MRRQLFGMFAWLAAVMAWPVASVAQDAEVPDRTLVELTTVTLRGGELGLIDRFLAYSTRACSLQETQAFSFKAAPEAKDNPYYAITVTMSDRGTPPEETCSGGTKRISYTRSVTATYRWDADKARFVAGSDAVQRLQEQTGAR